MTLLSVPGKTVRPTLILRYIFNIAEDQIKQARVIKQRAWRMGQRAIRIEKICDGREYYFLLPGFDAKHLGIGSNYNLFILYVMLHAFCSLAAEWSFAECTNNSLSM
jgi:hypothetical protein